jgi:hypothetical protein
MEPRTGLDGMEERKFLNLLGFEPRSLGRLVCSQSVHVPKLFPLIYFILFVTDKSLNELPMLPFTALF